MREELLSVGIDIGTSTTQLIFSKLFIENMASNYTVPRIVIVDKQIIYRSDIYFTPLISQKEIDGKGVREIIVKEYENAGIRKEDIKTGAVIITGETARKENAKEVLTYLSDFAGDFVVATAGPDLESIIAGKGAGINTFSKEQNTTNVHIDIGGGTSNIVVFQRGEVKETGCMDIGGRLIKIEPSTHKIIYITPKLREIIHKKNLPLAINSIATKENLTPMIDSMVEALEEAVGLRPRTELYDLLATHKNYSSQTICEYISFSGGVADFIYSDKEEGDIFQYGDIGILLGQAIKKSKLCEKFEVVKGAETIRATVVGAGTHTTEISGSTITYTKDAFPMKNLPILKLALEEETQDSRVLEGAIKKKLEWFKLEDQLQRVAIAMEGKINPSFTEIEEYAEGLINGMKELLQRELPFIIIIENDMAKVLGQTIYRKMNYQKDIICIDNIHLENGDYIDIGTPVAEGAVVPVVIKTLVFQ